MAIDYKNLVYKIKNLKKLDNEELRALPLKSKVNYIIKYNNLNGFTAKDVWSILKAREAIFDHVSISDIENSLNLLYRKK